MIQRFFLRWFMNSFGIWVATQLVNGFDYSGQIATIVLAGLVFSFINAVIRPIIVIMSLPALLLTLGLFVLIINAIMIRLLDFFVAGITVDSFTAALFAAIIVSVVNYLLSLFVDEESLHSGGH